MNCESGQWTSWATRTNKMYQYEIKNLHKFRSLSDLLSSFRMLPRSFITLLRRGHRHTLSPSAPLATSIFHKSLASTTNTTTIWEEKRRVASAVGAAVKWEKKTKKYDVPSETDVSTGNERQKLVPSVTCLSTGEKFFPGTIAHGSVRLCENGTWKQFVVPLKYREKEDEVEEEEEESAEDPTTTTTTTITTSNRKGQWRPKCEVEGCKVSPRYGSSEDMIARRCATHQKTGDLRMDRGKMCEHDGCKVRATFGDASLRGIQPQHQILKWCKKHMNPDRDVNIASQQCHHVGCDVQATFGSLDDNVPRWCRKHAIKGQVSNISNLCFGLPSNYLYMSKSYIILFCLHGFFLFFSLFFQKTKFYKKG